MSEIAESITTPLTHEECATMARAIAADETNWRPHVKHDPGTRHYARIERNDDYEVYVICWMDDHDTGFHDHDVSAGGVHVIEGGIFEERLGFGTGHLERLVGPGETIEFAPSSWATSMKTGGASAGMLKSERNFDLSSLSRKPPP